MQTDVLSDVLRAVRLTGAVYFDFELSEPWVLEAPPRIAAVAEAVGYESESSFSRAFKNWSVKRPAAWRRTHRPISNAT